MKKAVNLLASTTLVALTALLTAQTLPPADQAATRHAWRDAFDRVYSLKDGEVLKFIPAPYIPERASFFHEVDKSDSDAAFPFHAFLYDRGFLTRGQMESGAGPAGIGVEAVIRGCVHTNAKRIVIDPKVLGANVTGDWIVQEQASPDEVLKAFAAILQRDFHINVAFEKATQKQQLVLEVTGNYHFTRLTDVDNDAIQVFSDKLDHPKPGDRVGGGGYTSPQEFWAIMEDYLRLPVVDESKGEPALLPFAISWSAVDQEGKQDIVAANIARQTGLSIQLKNRDLEVWKAVPAKPAPVPAPAKM